MTRRSLLQLIAGTAAGAAVTPLPWKLLDDVSIWTQNWALTPRLVRGEISSRRTSCGICGGGCGLQVRFLDDVPIAATGLEAHPVSGGGCCPVGLGLPRLRFHPTRAVKPVIRSSGGELRPATMEEALAAVGERLAACREKPDSAGIVAVLDWRPGSAVSVLYERLLDQIGRGLLVTPVLPERRADIAAAELVGQGPGRVGYDLAGARTVLGCGVPLFDGWGAQGPMAALARRWKELSPKERPHLIQADPNHTVTASMAGTWLPIEPGSEVALVLGIARELIAGELVDLPSLAARYKDLAAYRALVAPFTAERVAGLTGLAPEQLRETARRLAADGPSVVVGGGGAGAGPLGEQEENAIFGLNLLLGADGAPGGVRPLRRWAPEEERPQRRSWRRATIDTVIDGSIGLFIIDGSLPTVGLPRRLLARKLAPGGLVVSLNPFLAGSNLAADVVLPTAVVGEWEQDLLAPPGAPVASYAVTAALGTPPPGVSTPPEMIRRIARAAGGEIADDELEKRFVRNAGAIVAAGRGRLFDATSGETKPAAEAAGGKELLEILRRGGVWIDDPAPLEAGDGSPSLLGADQGIGVRIRAMADKGRMGVLRGDAKKLPLALMPFGARVEAGEGALPRLLTKLYRETGLRDRPTAALVNPTTAGELGLGHRRPARLTTDAGALDVEVFHDRATRPGVVRVAVGPDPVCLGDAKEGRPTGVLDVAELYEDSVWRLSRARLEERGDG